MRLASKGPHWKKKSCQEHHELNSALGRPFPPLLCCMFGRDFHVVTVHFCQPTCLPADQLVHEPAIEGNQQTGLSLP